ncbi:Ras-related protein Rab-4B [Tritrichomonas foetus]|uniref:Ras-related protein Rab-4B n=1 Tax=Tritrichomonas foetus TaxID=1144522 RepID=A0A1J4KSQ2_9EUKA|nr:Ras-related protein Rab-4B [Tritrichomonas foetus]|eukprot:OHT14291.1 Ras-related protein Rab-4B [Tritrichomonas foetus]
MNMDQKTIPRYKVIIIGNSMVGKTSIVESFTGSLVSKQHFPTVGTGFYPAELNINGKDIIFDIWDTAGQEMYRALVPQYVRGSAGALIVYDITSRDSFNSLDSWLEIVKPYSSSIITFLFGNKTDNEQNRQVSYDEAVKYATDNEMKYSEGSAMTGDMIQSTFFKFFQVIVKNGKPRTQQIQEVTETPEKNCC